MIILDIIEDNSENYEIDRYTHREKIPYGDEYTDITRKINKIRMFKKDEIQFIIKDEHLNDLINNILELNKNLRIENNELANRVSYLSGENAKKQERIEILEKYK